MTERHLLSELLVFGGTSFILTQAVLSLALSPGQTPTDGNPLWKLILSLSYLAVAAILVQNYGHTLAVFRRNLLLLALVLLALVSCCWATTPSLVLQRSVAVLGTTLVGVGLAVRLPLEDQLRLMSWIFRLITLLSLVCVVLLPQYGISDWTQNHGEWRGVFGHKNELGSAMALAVLVESQLPARTHFSRFVKALSLLLSSVLLLFSNSLTPTLALAGSLLLIGMYRVAVQWLRMPLYAIVFATVLIVASTVLVLAANSGRAAAVLGRSSDLTGRAQIWDLVVSYALDRPFFGYGYSGFWYGASPESVTVNQIMGMPIMYSHNGYLEIFLALGAAGLILAVAFLVLGIRRALHYSEYNRSDVSLWPLAFLFYFLLHNLTECTILFQDLEWAICVATIATVDPALFSLGVKYKDEPLLTPIEQPT